MIFMRMGQDVEITYTSTLSLDFTFEWMNEYISTGDLILPSKNVQVWFFFAFHFP